MQHFGFRECWLQDAVIDIQRTYCILDDMYVYLCIFTHTISREEHTTFDNHVRIRWFKVRNPLWSKTQTLNQTLNPKLYVV